MTSAFRNMALYGLGRPAERHVRAAALRGLQRAYQEGRRDELCLDPLQSEDAERIATAVNTSTP